MTQFAEQSYKPNRKQRQQRTTSAFLFSLTQHLKRESNMKQESNDLFTTSRRGFATGAAAALISGAFVSTLHGAQKKTKSQKSRALSISPKTKGFRKNLDGGIEEHIPPMTLNDGSFEMNLHGRFNTPTRVGNVWQYRLPSFGNITKVMVIVTNEQELFTSYGALIGPPLCNARNIVIKLWLHKREGSVYGAVNTTLPPDVIISSPGELQMQINEELARSDARHPHRTNRYVHPGATYGEAHFKIGALEISSSGCSTE